MTLFTSDLYRTVLLTPPSEAESLYIVTGYASYAMALKHVNDLQQVCNSVKEVHTVIGMTAKNGILSPDHYGFQKIMKTSSGKHEFLYIPEDKPPVHSKSYVWCDRNKKPLLAYIGSANYTQAAFLGGNQKELLCSADPFSVFKYFKDIEKDAIRCTYIEADSLIVKKLKSYRPNDNPTLDSIEYSSVNKDQIVLSLLTEEGTVGFGSGVNWGHRRNGVKREPNQAYIAIPAKIRREYPDFFPKRSIQFTVLTDDNKPIVCAVAQDGDKAIESTENNSILGMFIRQRMGLKAGQFITKEDFDRYGRSDVTITKIDDENFLLDFSVQR